MLLKWQAASARLSRQGAKEEHTQSLPSLPSISVQYCLAVPKDPNGPSCLSNSLQQLPLAWSSYPLHQLTVAAVTPCSSYPSYPSLCYPLKTAWKQSDWQPSVLDCLVPNYCNTASLVGSVSGLLLGHFLVYILSNK